MAEIINTAVYKLRLDMSELESDLKKANQMVANSTKATTKNTEDVSNKATKEISKTSTAMSTLIASATSKAFNVASSGVTSFAKNILSVGTGFESTMAQVSAISGATGSDLQSLTDKAAELGRATKYSASEVGEGFTYMAMAGWETEDMLAGIGGMLNLATAGCTDLGVASDIVTDNLTAFGMSAEETDRMVDAMAATVTGSNTTVELMGETLKYVGSTAGALGYSFEDCSVAIGLMANAGIKGSQAGTSLRSVMNRLANDTGGATTTLQEMGVEIVNADGSMRDFGDVMTDMRGVFANLSEAEKAQLASTIAGTEGMSGLLAIVNASEDDYAKLTDSINNSAGAAQEMSDIMGNTTENRIKELQSKIQDLQIKAFNALQPAIDAVISTLGFFADHMEITIPLVIALGAAFVAVKVSGLISSLVSLGGVIFGTVIPAILSTTAALLTSPITWIVLGIAAIIAAILALIANFDKVKEVVGAVFGWIGNFIGGVVENIKGFFQGAWDFITGIFSGIGEFFGSVFEAAFNIIKGVFEGVVGFFGGIWDTIVGIFGGIGTAIGDAVSGAFKFVVNGILSFVENFINTPINIINTALSGINAILGIVGINLGKLPTVSLPRMYTGGIVPAVSGGTPIIAGDGGEDEWVVPESKMASLLEQLENRGNLESGNTYNIYVEGVFATSVAERRKVADQIVEAINQNNRRRFAQ